MSSSSPIFSPASLPAKSVCAVTGTSNERLREVRLCSNVRVSTEDSVGEIEDGADSSGLCTPSFLAWRIAAFTRNPSYASEDAGIRFMSDYENEDSENEQPASHNDVDSAASASAQPGSPSCEDEGQLLRAGELNWDNVEVDGVDLLKCLALLQSLKQLLHRGAVAEQADREAECCSPTIRRRSVPAVEVPPQKRPGSADRDLVDEAEYVLGKPAQVLEKPSNGQSTLWQRRRMHRMNRHNHSF